MDKWKQLAASKENRWYYASLENRIPPSSRKLLEEYSDVPAEDVDNHVYRLVSFASSLFPSGVLNTYSGIDKNQA